VKSHWAPGSEGLDRAKLLHLVTSIASALVPPDAGLAQGGRRRLARNVLRCPPTSCVLIGVAGNALNDGHDLLVYQRRSAADVVPTQQHLRRHRAGRADTSG